MSKCKSDDFECKCDKCEECEEHSSSKHSCGPIDIDIKVNCCPPDDNGNGNGNGDDNGCCCNEGMAEALEFIQEELQEAGLIRNNGLDIFGINAAPLAGGATIEDVIGTDIVEVMATGNPSQQFISTCAIYFIDISLNLNLNNADDLATFNEILRELRQRFNSTEFDDCCCKDGVARILNDFRNTRVQLNMNNQTGTRGDVDGTVITLDSDVVWLNTTTGGGNPRLTVASICYIASIAPRTTGA